MSTGDEAAAAAGGGSDPNAIGDEGPGEPGACPAGCAAAPYPSPPASCAPATEFVTGGDCSVICETDAEF